MGQAYRAEYDFHVIYLLPVNLYGPGDHFFEPEKSHVIPALIRKFVDAREAGAEEVTVWGSGFHEGVPVSREFLYVDDAAEGIVLAAERYNKPEPVNIGSGREIKIRALTEMVCDLCGFKGEIRWDSNQPDGQPRRCLDTTRAEKEFGFRARTSLRD